MKVVIAKRTADLGTRVTIDDTGPALPAGARRALLTLELDPGTHGRPSAVPLYVASEIALWQGALGPTSRSKDMANSGTPIVKNPLPGYSIR